MARKVESMTKKSRKVRVFGAAARASTVAARQRPATRLPVRSGVFDAPEIENMRGVVSIDEQGKTLEWYYARVEVFKESRIDEMRATLFAWNMTQRACKLLPG